MLVLLSFVLVLVATVLLVLGLLVSDDGITLIYLSIAMSAVAAVLLVVAVRKSKPQLAAAGGPAPLLPEEDALVAVPQRERELATVGAPTQTVPAVAPSPASEATAAVAAVPQAPPPIEPAEADDEEAPAAASGEWLASDTEWGGAEGDEWPSGADDVEFPIADYDDLALDELLPLLPQLYSDELDVVEAREREGLNRREVLDRLAELRITGTEADAALVDGGVGAAEPEATWEPEAASAEADGPSALPGYDAMAVSQIVAALPGLSDAELDEIRAHEAATKNRRTVLTAVDRRLGVVAEAAPVAAKKAPARKKAAAVKKAAPARKAAAPVRKKAAAPARKAAAPAKKAPAPAKKAAAPVRKKAAAPVKKAAAPAKKAATKKAAAPVKKAAKRR